MTRRIGPALIAVLVVLAAGAGTGAFFVVRAVLGQPPSNTAVNGPASQHPSAPGAASQGPTTATTNAIRYPAPTADACPAFTVAAVKRTGRPGSLKLQLYVEADLAEAWVCQDSDGALYYQGHNKSGPATDATTSNTILIGPGVRGTVEAAGTGYLATNTSTDGTTQYIVNLEALIVRLPSGEQQTYTVTRHVSN